MRKRVNRSSRSLEIRHFDGALALVARLGDQGYQQIRGETVSRGFKLNVFGLKVEYDNFKFNYLFEKFQVLLTFISQLFSTKQHVNNDQNVHSQEVQKSPFRDKLNPDSPKPPNACKIAHV